MLIIEIIGVTFVGLALIAGGIGVTQRTVTALRARRNQSKEGS